MKTSVNVAVATLPAVFAPAQSNRDDRGSGVATIQVEVPPTVTAINYDIVARASPEAPWVNLLSGQTAGMLQSMNWTPFVGIRINSATGTGSVNLWVETA